MVSELTSPTHDNGRSSTYVIRSEKRPLWHTDVFLIAAINNKSHNFIVFRIFPDIYYTCYCLEAMKILAPNSVPFHF